jgi:HSP20 family molecular chaperone IbpA
MNSKLENTQETKHNLMVEEVTVTSFFKKHKKHMPATIKLHAELKEEKDHIILESKVPGHNPEDIKVSATPNTINVDLILERIGEEEIKFHNCYLTPAPIDPTEMEIIQKDSKVTVKVRKK